MSFENEKGATKEAASAERSYTQNVGGAGHGKGYVSGSATYAIKLTEGTWTFKAEYANNGQTVDLNTGVGGKAKINYSQMMVEVH
jgi:hypothetical protein